jgi:hypothetical protein
VCLLSEDLPPAQPADDPEAEARVKAFFARNVRLVGADTRPAITCRATICVRIALPRLRCSHLPDCCLS